MEERQSASPGDPPNGENDADEPAVARHATLPHPEQHERPVEDGVEIVKEEIAEASADKNADDQCDDEVRHEVGRQRGAPGAMVPHHQPAAHNESQHIGQSVPANANVPPETDGKRTQIVDPIGERQ